MAKARPKHRAKADAGEAPLLRLLVGRGFFPSQLPPAFSTTRLAEANDVVHGAILTTKRTREGTRGEAFSVARAGHLRRQITVPNPVFQVQLCHAVAQHWATLDAHFARSALSLSRPSPSEDARGGRALPIVSLRDLERERLLRSAGYRFVLKTDVARFFPSLYTHAIAWALHAKATAKDNRSTGQNGLLGNELDALVRATQENQTIGVPIGPDTSHVLAEIVATAVDLGVAQRLGEPPAGYRHVDDYFLCFETSAAAERGLAAVVASLHDFELEVNAAKTTIVEAETLREDEWVTKLEGSEIAGHRQAERQARDLRRFFSTLAEVGARDESAVRYGLKLVARTHVAEENMDVFAAHLLRSAWAAPNCMSLVARILATYHAMGTFKPGQPGRQAAASVGADALTRFCSAVVARCAPAGHHSEVVWALRMMRDLGIRLRASVLKPLEDISSPVCALVALDLRDRGLVRGKMDVSRWEAALGPDALDGSDWLLAYEAHLKGWLKPKDSGFLAARPAFEVMHNADVSFYDATAMLPPLLVRQEDPWSDDDWEPAEDDDDVYAA